MKSVFVAFGLILALATASEASVFRGVVNLGPNLVCSVPNATGYGFAVGGIQYEYTCMNPYSGASFTYTPYVYCTANCGLYPFSTMNFVGPSTFNCNVVAAACVAYTAP
ncbi:hypothetical protein WDW86_12560 [Bdellovibrionota bacterium FG-2]